MHVGGAYGSELKLIDHSPAEIDVATQGVAGLTRHPKTLPCALLYDEAGSALFESITQLPEYYPTRTEISILRTNLGQIQAAIGPGARLVELGSGSATKTRILLTGLAAREYVPIDIARAQLIESATSIAQDFPEIDVSAVCADYTQRIDLPPSKEAVTRTVVFFPGSTIGNFEPPEALAFLKRLQRLSGKAGGLLIGVDLKKDAARLERAYNDAAGVTAAFNLNVLQRLNRDAGADFDIAGFQHRAIFNEPASRIEMHLISLRDQCVLIGSAGVAAPRKICFHAGESIVTEHSYKYSVESFHALAKRAGWMPRQTWVDADCLFSVHWLTARSDRK